MKTDISKLSAAELDELLATVAKRRSELQPASQQAEVGGDVPMQVIVGGDYIKLLISDVLYFRADMKYIFAATARRSFKFESSLDSIEREYPGLFWRVHRKYLVKGAAVKGLVKIDGSLYVDVAGTTESVPVSRREAPRVRDLFRAEAMSLYEYYSRTKLSQLP